MSNVNDIIKSMRGMSLEQLREINRAAIAYIDLERQKTKLSFRQGETVEFDSKYGVKIVGTVTKICQKNIQVRQTNIAGPNPVGCRWTVSPSLLRKHA